MQWPKHKDLKTNKMVLITIQTLIICLTQGAPEQQVFSIYTSMYMYSVNNKANIQYIQLNTFGLN